MSCLRAELERRRFPVTLEITPPARPGATRVLFRRARALEPVVQAVNVIQRPERLSSLEASLLLRRAGLEPVLHVVNRGRSRASIRAELCHAARGRVANVVCMRGDHAAGDRRDTPNLRETVELARELHPHALIGATLNPHLPPRRVFGNLFPKLAAGAGFVQTQPVFDAGAFFRFAESLKDSAPDVHLLPMVMPIFSYDVARRVEKRLRIALPSALLADLERGVVSAGWDWFSDGIAQLAECPWVDGLVVTTPTMDIQLSLARRLAACLSRARVDRIARLGVETAGSE